MIEDIKNILRKILENPDKIEFESYECSMSVDNNGKEKVEYAINYKSGNNKFLIEPFLYNKIYINKNNNKIELVKCSQEDYLEISLLIFKLNKIYKDKAYDEFKHSLD